MDSQIEEVKNKLDVVDVVGSYIKLTKTGLNYRGVCPFHSEKKPSFFVSPTRQMWKCFGCGAGHSIFDFVMKIEGLEFGDALRILANKAGVELKKENVQLKTERQRLYEVCELACKFFEKQLEASSIGKEAEAYLLKRGLNKESIKKWRLGYSPDTWQGLSDFLIGKGYKREEIVKAGLAVVPQDGIPLRGKKEDDIQHSYDRFRGRIVFPIFDMNSQVVGFGARVFKTANEKETAKYINTPQTLIYNKSNILYGLNNAKLAMRKADLSVVTEGYTDVIMCHQAGFENTVAASGTALTGGHLDILKRYSENLVLAFDMDLAGDTATKRGINLAQEKGFNIKVIQNYGAKDPADIILENAENWKNILANVRSIMDYYFDSAFSAFDRAVPEGKKKIAAVILPVVKKLPNKIEQSYWVQKLSAKLGIKEDAIFAEMDKIKIETAQQQPEEFKPAIGQYKDIGARKKMIEENIISLLVKNPENMNLIEDSHICLFSDSSKQFLENIKKGQGEAGRNFFETISLRKEVELEEGTSEGDKNEISLCLLQLKNIELKNKLNSLSESIKRAEFENDHEKVGLLTEEFNKLTKEI